MRPNWLRFFLLISLALNFSFLFTVGYMHFKQEQYWTTPFGGKIEKNKFLFEGLSLQPEQRQKMKQRALSFRGQVDGKRKVIAEKRKKLFALLRADQSDTPAIDAAIKDLSSMQEDLQKTIVFHILGTKDLLDKEQQNRLFDLIENTMHSGGQIECLPHDKQ